MKSAEYLVIQRQSQWWVMLDGLGNGPYLSRQMAIDSAVISAKVVFKTGKTARVSVEHGGDPVTAYDSGFDQSSDAQ